jgi:hypothetical protein
MHCIGPPMDGTRQPRLTSQAELVQQYWLACPHGLQAMLLFWSEMQTMVGPQAVPSGLF